MRTHLLTATLTLIILPTTLHAEVKEQSWGTSRDNTPIKAFTITNTSGAEARVITHGATLQSLKIPDRDKKPADIVLGFDDAAGYTSRQNPFFGATIGRNCNRINNAKFTLEGNEYTLPANDGKNNLHSGPRGFDRAEWDATTIDNQTVEFSYSSKDGEEGFPGNLQVRVRYTLSDDNALSISYEATTDKATIVNLTNHSYFNLAGEGNGNILKQELTIDADEFTPATEKHIPTGALAPVAATPFNFRNPHAIGERIHDENDQLKFAGGYDINFVLRKKEGLREAATVYDPTSGRLMKVLTTEPALQFYSGNGLGRTKGKNGTTYERYGGFALETQHFPDAPNHPDFPSTTLNPGQTYHSKTIYQFTIQK